MRELNMQEVEQVSGATFTDIAITGGALAGALTRNPVIASGAAGYALGTAIYDTYGTQISDAVWSVSQTIKGWF